MNKFHIYKGKLLCKSNINSFDISNFSLPKVFCTILSHVQKKIWISFQVVGTCHVEQFFFFFFKTFSLRVWKKKVNKILTGGRRGRDGELYSVVRVDNRRQELFFLFFYGVTVGWWMFKGDVSLFLDRFRNGKHDQGTVRDHRSGLPTDGSHGVERSSALRWQAVEVCRRFLLRYHRPDHYRYWSQPTQTSTKQWLTNCCVCLRLRTFDTAHDRR